MSWLTDCGAVGSVPPRPRPSSKYSAWSRWYVLLRQSYDPGYARFTGAELDYRWLDFEVFWKDTGPSPKRYSHLKKLDPQKPWGPDNFYWSSGAGS